MPIEHTKNFNLAVVPADDTDTTFKSWRVALDAPSDSNMTKIDEALMGTMSHPISITEEELDKTWKPGWYMCQMTPFEDDTLAGKLLVKVINQYDDGDGSYNVSQIIFTMSGSSYAYRLAYSTTAQDYSQVFEMMDDEEGFKQWTLLSSTPRTHADKTDKYGKGTDTQYGHVKLTDLPADASATTCGTALTPKALYEHQNSVGNKTTHGHLNLSDEAEEDLDVTQHTAATPKALADTKQKLEDRIDDLEALLTIGVRRTNPDTDLYLADMVDDTPYTGDHQATNDYYYHAKIHPLTWYRGDTEKQTPEQSSDTKTLGSNDAKQYLTLSYDFDSSTMESTWGTDAAAYNSLPKYDGSVLSVKGGCLSWANTEYEQSDDPCDACVANDPPGLSKELQDHEKAHASKSQYGHVEVKNGLGSSTRRANKSLGQGYGDDESAGESTGIAATPYGVVGTVMGSVVMPYATRGLSILSQNDMDNAKLTGWYSVFGADKFSYLNQDYPGDQIPQYGFASSALMLVLNFGADVSQSSQDRVVQIVFGTENDNTSWPLIVIRSWLLDDRTWSSYHLLVSRSKS